MSSAARRVERSGAPTTPNDLLQQNCVQFTLSDRIDEWEFQGSEQLVRVPIAGRYGVTSILAVRDALLAGFGLSLVPRIYVAEQNQAWRAYDRS